MEIFVGENFVGALESEWSQDLDFAKNTTTLFFLYFFFVRDHCEQPDRNKDLYEELRSDMHRLNGKWTAE